MKKLKENLPKTLEDESKREFIGKAGILTSAGLLMSGFPYIASASLKPKTLCELRSIVQGVVVEKDTPYYEPWRQSMVWQYRKFGRYPDIIVQARSQEDVIAAVNFARVNGMKVTTRCGGHSWSGCFLRDSGVLIDVSSLQGVVIDKDRGVAEVGPGVIGRSLNEQLASQGLAFPTAHCGMVPLSGFLLGGGLGWNARAWGAMAAFNILGVDVVTAEGEHLYACEDQNQDIYWAARGAGPGLFFTVTKFYLKCFPLPRKITEDAHFFYIEDFTEVVQAIEEFAPKLDANVEILSVVIPPTPELAHVCKDKCDKVVAMFAIAFADDEAEYQRMIGPINSHRVIKKSILSFTGHTVSFEDLYQENEGPFPQGRAIADNIYTDRAADLVPVVTKHIVKAPSEKNTPVLVWRGDLDFKDAACSMTGDFYLSCYAQWGGKENDLKNKEWLRLFYDELQPFANGYYINEFDREHRSSQTARCFLPSNWQKIQDLRNKYDPEGVFHNFIEI